MTDNVNLVPGHNSANVDDEDGADLVSLNPEIITEDLKTRFQKEFARGDALIASFETFKVKFSDGIHDDETAAKAGEFAVQIKKCSKALDVARLAEKRPFDDAGKAVHSLFKSSTDKLDAANKAVLAKSTSYLVAKEARERAERIEQARQEAEKARMAELEAQKSGDAADLDVALAVAENAEKVEKEARASTADMSRIRGNYGGTTSLARMRKFRVTDISKVPARYLVVDPAKVTPDIKEYKDGDDQPIPGIEIYFETSARAR